METTIKKWGNSFGVRIPSSIVKALNIYDGTPIILIQRDEEIIIKPLSSKKDQLFEMLAKIEENNIHSETDYGKEEGGEIW